MAITNLGDIKWQKKVIHDDAKEDKALVKKMVKKDCLK